MKKCPYCYTDVDDRATICPACRKKIGRVDKQGIAKKEGFTPTEIWGSIVIIIMLIIFFIFFIYPNLKTP